MAIQDDSTLLTKGDLKEYHEAILPYLGGNAMLNISVSNYYSTNEKIVGVWTNGKPLYQKTFIFSGISNGKTIPLDIPNFEYLVSIQGTIHTGDNKAFDNGAVDVANGAFVRPQVYDGKIGLSISGFGEDWASGGGTYTIQYTKTTDTEGSATATPGCYDLNRPDLWPNATEIFFGNGLYGFRYTGTCPEKDSPTTILTLTNNAKIVNTGGGIKFTNGSAIAPFPYTFCDISGNIQHNYGIHISNGEVRIFNRSSATGGYAGGPIDMWFTYIK